MCQAVKWPKFRTFGQPASLDFSDGVVRLSGHGVRARHWLEGSVMVALAGVVAQAVLTGRNNHIDPSGDYVCAKSHASCFCKDDEVLTKYLDYMIAQTGAFIQNPVIW